MSATPHVITAHHKREALGLHHLSNHNAVLPWSGGYGRMSEERCRAARLVFPSLLAASIAITPFLREDCLWTLVAVPLTGVDDSPDCGMPKAPQTWNEQLSDFTAAEIIAVLGCPQATAYSWKREKSPRTPPDWLQPLILRELRRSRLP